MNKSRKYPDECFPDPKINKPFTMNQEFLILRLLGLKLSLVSERTPKRVNFRLKF